MITIDDMRVTVQELIEMWINGNCKDVMALLFEHCENGPFTAVLFGTMLPLPEHDRFLRMFWDYSND